ncbi:MAG: His-Xaa-Ser system protein HxsD [Myxococcales bacterium]|nr:His-Xaa-Ser system protein HxsD [Myxococcales bacterium]
MDRDPFSFEEGLLRCDVDTAVYRVAAVQKAAYKLAALATIHIAERGPEKLTLTFMFAEPKGEEAARSVGRRFLEELLDQELREAVRAQTEPLRMLVLAHAFSRTGLVKSS